jgi:hypothetical protein
LDAALAESVGSAVGLITVPIYRTRVPTALMALTRGNCSTVVGFMVVAFMAVACLQDCMGLAAACMEQEMVD